jgi:hypothetical protein
MVDSYVGRFDIKYPKFSMDTRDKKFRRWSRLRRDSIRRFTTRP